MGDVLKAPDPTTSIGGDINYSESYISTLNTEHPWLFGILETGQLVICYKKFHKDYIRWSTQTNISNVKGINVYSLNLKFKIARNGHLIMTANNILADYNAELDDEYKVDTSQELVIWDSLPKSLPFNVGHYGSTGYTLVINEINGGSSCEVVLYDGLFSQIWRITPEDQLLHPDSYVGYAFPIEYNLPLKFKTEPSNDIHNYIEYNVDISKYHSELLFDCNVKINENESMVSDNGIYRFYLQSTGNLVVKEYNRTMWSSNTAIVDPFESPFTVSLSLLGELILRDRHNYIIWQSINPYAISNKTYRSNSPLQKNDTNIIKSKRDEEFGFGDFGNDYNYDEDDDVEPYDFNNENNDINNAKTSTTTTATTATTTITTITTSTNNSKTSTFKSNNTSTSRPEVTTTTTTVSKTFTSESNSVPVPTNTETSYRLKLTDNGELKIVDNNNRIIWSNWFVRKNNFHRRYVEPLVYAISSCNEEIRLPYVYNLHSYEQPNHDDIQVDPYFNNLLPGEMLRFEHNNEAYLLLTKTELIWNNFIKNETIATCSNAKELKILDDGLFLYCDNDDIKPIASLKHNNKYTLTIKKNL